MKTPTLNEKAVITVFVIFMLVGLIFPRETNKKKFQIELHGGLSLLSPNDLNLKSDFLKSYNELFFDDLYRLQEEEGFITSWTKNIDGEHEKIKHAIPFLFRVKYYFNNSLAISLGLKYLSKNQSSDVHMTFTTESPYANEVSTKSYSPYTLSIEAVVPMAGVHFEKRISQKMAVSGFLTAGPLFGRCGYSYRVNTDTELGYSVYNWGYFLETKGKGNGVALEGGVQLKFLLGKAFSLFIECGYALQKVLKLSGTGIIDYQDELRENKVLEGEWLINEVSYRTAWGDKLLLEPSIEPEVGPNTVRNFNLDLSGFQVRVGIGFRFKP